MLLHENYTIENIKRLQAQTGADPSILERTVFAFGLLEALCSVGMPFVFKGGTSLLLLLKKPRRLSTDIDIIVDKEIDVDSYIKQVGSIFPFISVEEHRRKGINDIEKRHFRFMFLSPMTSMQINVLLDIVFEDSKYLDIVEIPIKNNLLITDDKDVMVNIPNKNCVLGDKLTAFAPHTTGIPFGIDKELEIIKQLYDCWTLLQEMDDYAMVSRTYEIVSQKEIEYRGLDVEPSDCLKDTIDGCICIIARGSIKPVDYKCFLSGINAIQGHVFGERVNGEKIAIYACEIMYLATRILTRQVEYISRISIEDYINKRLPIKGIKKISGIRNTNPWAYAYMVRSIELLNERGLYTESIEK